MQRKVEKKEREREMIEIQQCFYLRIIGNSENYTRLR